MTRPLAPSAPARRRVILIDGRCHEYLTRATWSDIVADAIRTSRRHPDASVAIARLGDVRSLRRFSAGREVLA